MKKAYSVFVILLLLSLAANSWAIPAAPTMNYETDGLNVTISWNEVPGATGYKLYYAPYPHDNNPESIGHADVGTLTSKSYYLWEGAAYHIAVTAYDGTGESGYSNISYFIMGPPTPEWVDDDGDGITEVGGDCDDTDASVNPQGTEICGDAIDQDCSGADLVCPIALVPPVLTYTTTGLNVTANWSSVTGATGYKLYYAPSPYAGPETINSVDVGDHTSKSFSLWEGAAYHLAVAAYNNTSESGYSNIVQFTIEPIAPQTAKVIVVGDDRHPALADFLTSKGLTVESFNNPYSYDPKIDGDLVVWTDGRNGNDDIYAYNLATQTEFRVNQDSGTASQGNPDVSGNLIVWQDWRNDDPDIYAYNVATATEFKVNQDSGTAYQDGPAVSGDLIVWSDDRNGKIEIYAYNLATQTEFKVSQDPGTNGKGSVAVSGNLIVWQDLRNGNPANYTNYDIYAYDVTTSKEFKVNQDSGNANQTQPAVSGNVIVWQDSRDASYGSYAIYGYDVIAKEEFRADQKSGDASQGSPDVSGSIVVWTDSRSQEVNEIYGIDLSASVPVEFKVGQAQGNNPAVSGTRVVWEDNRYEQGPFEEIYLYDLANSTQFNLSGTNKTTLQIIETRLAEFGMILFGDRLDDYASNLALFDAADAAGIPMLGIGTRDNEDPIGGILVSNDRFGLVTAGDAGTAAMHIVVTSTGTNHAIFDGINTAATLVLNSALKEGDEQSYDINISDPNAPADWKVLANLGSGMSNAGQPAIVEFTTANGTTVMLDGSANTYNGYKYWTQERWDILYNQVMYLMEK